MKTAIIAVAFLLCAACGQKGPLYLPQPARSAVPATAPAPTPAPAPAGAAAGAAADQDTDPNSSQKQKGSTAP
jgi:predicted small lipoprotein YifL